MNDHCPTRFPAVVTLLSPVVTKHRLASIHRLSAVLLIGAILLGTTVFPGCGSSGPERYDVSGTVTFNGKPIPAGQVFFTPDTAKGNRGPQGKGKIVNGEFSTESDENLGVIGGPQQVKVLGFDGVPVKSPDYTVEEGTALFPSAETSVDLPKGPATLALDVRFVNGRVQLTAEVKSP